MSILRALFGGSKQRNSSSSSSDNRAYDAVSGVAVPALGVGANALNRMSSELEGGFDGFKRNAGFDFMMGEGLRGITGSQASRGMLRSGATGRGIAKFGNNLQSQMYENYLNRMGQLSQLGQGFGSLLVGAGQRSQSQSQGTGSSQGGILSTLFG